MSSERPFLSFSFFEVVGAVEVMEVARWSVKRREGWEAREALATDMLEVERMEEGRDARVSVLEEAAVWGRERRDLLVLVVERLVSRKRRRWWTFGRALWLALDVFEVLDPRGSRYKVG
jgi:hypothetical protein